MSEPTVSVLVKAYNHEPYVRQTIESVLGQSFGDFEIVVADDGSTDGTPDVVRSFKDPRVHLEVHPRNLGIPAAMNACVARARGRYLAILNSDDWALPDRLALQVAFLDDNPDVSVLFGLPRTVGEANEPIAAYDDFQTPLRFPDFSRRTWLRHFFFAGNCLCAPTAMIRREAYDKVGPYDRRLTNLQDLDMWVRMALAGCNIHVLPVELTAFRIRAGLANMSAPRRDSKFRSTFETSKILKRFCQLDRESFEHIFGEEAAQSSSADAPVGLRLAELALRDRRISYQTFAVDCYHELAFTDSEFDRLRFLSGSADALGSASISDLREKFRRVAQRIANSPYKNSAHLPADFDPTQYVLAHEDLLADEVDAFEHYLNFGRAEGRTWR